MEDVALRGCLRCSSNARMKPCFFWFSPGGSDRNVIHVFRSAFTLANRRSEPYGEADTRAKLIDPAIYGKGWTGVPLDKRH